MTVSMLEKLHCASRELAVRRSSYPKRIAAGSMSAQQAAHEIARSPRWKPSWRTTGRPCALPIFSPAHKRKDKADER
jgi:hypothetical protein